MSKVPARAFASIGSWAQRHDQAGAGGRVAYAHQHTVALVEGLAGDVHLGREARQPGSRDREMDVGRPAGIGHGPDRAEPVAARFIGDGLAVALEIVVERRVGTGVPDVMVAAVCVALPDLDPAHRIGADRPDQRCAR